MRLTRETLTDESWPAREGELRRLQDRLGTTRPRVRWSLVAALSALAVMLPAAWLVLKQPSALTFEVIHGTVAASGEIRPLDSGTRIQFSDGSQVVLDDGARTQVRDLAADGARIVLTRGRAHTYFVPRPHAHWQVAAGPYVVQVTGTIFDVEWSEENQALDVWLHKGSVTVRGPLIDGGVVMTRGQHLLMRIRDNKIVLDKNGLETAAARLRGHAGSGDAGGARRRGRRGARRARGAGVGREAPARRCRRRSRPAGAAGRCWSTAGRGTWRAATSKRW